MELSKEPLSSFLQYNFPKYFSESPKHSYEVNHIDRISAISYQDFFLNYLLNNKPCLIAASIETWKSKQDWVGVTGKPNFAFFTKEFGSALVPVADCNIREYNSQLGKTMLFKDYLEYWQMVNEAENENLPSLYLKNWHFNREYPDYKAYETPVFFSSDWLNEFCQKEDDDYKFIYMGPKGTWTPLHVDVFGSYSWSVNICGRKRWLLFPPGNEEFLKDNLKQLMYNVEDINLKEKQINFLDVTQEEGEIIFVPSGWHHQVWNLDDTISINHNWFNGSNILYIWKCLNTAAVDVEREISDCKGSDDFENQVQLILRVHHGMNYEDFFKILDFICKSRIHHVQKFSSKNMHWQQIFDLVCLKNVCSDMINTPLPNQILKQLQELQNSIVSYLNVNKIKFDL